MQRSFSILVGLAVLVLLVAYLSASHPGGEWLAGILNAPWSPPGWFFVLGWSLFFTLQVVAAWLLCGSSQPRLYTTLILWAGQLVLHLAWSRVFFDLHRTGWALAVFTIYLLFSGVVFRAFRMRSRTASTVLLPCLAWLALVWMWLLAVWRISGGGLATIFQ